MNNTVLCHRLHSQVHTPLLHTSAMCVDLEHVYTSRSARAERDLGHFAAFWHCRADVHNNAPVYTHSQGAYAVPPTHNILLGLSVKAASALTRGVFIVLTSSSTDCK